MPRAVIVTGDRHGDAAWAYTIETALIGTDVIIHGAAPGIDTIAGLIGKRTGKTVLPMPAQWNNPKFKNRGQAGPERNAYMLQVLKALKETGYEVEVLAFHPCLAESKGTKDMVERAQYGRVPVRVFEFPS